jgi:hypothetical protein
MTIDPTFHGRGFNYWLQIRLSGDDEQRWEAVDAIRHICHPDTSIPLFLDTLRNDAYWRARALAAHALYDLIAGPHPDSRVADALPQLLEAANDPSPDVRAQIKEVLAALALRPNT